MRRWTTRFVTRVERKQFGKPIAEFQVIARDGLADMATDVEAARWITASTAWRYDQGLPCVKLGVHGEAVRLRRCSRG